MPTESVRIARGAIVQQAAQVLGVVSMLAVVTVLGRSLPLATFGLYGLLLSVASYALVIQVSIGGAVVRSVSSAKDGAAVNRVLSTAMAVYSLAGVVVGGLVVAGGLGVLRLAHIPAELRTDARQGVMAVGLVLTAGWPLKVFQDALRGTQRFFDASVTEILAHASYATMLVSLTVLSAPIWVLAAVGASLPLLTGAYSAAAIARRHLPLHLRRDHVDAEVARELVAFSRGLGAIAATDLLVYSLDRVVLATFRNAATVGLYEAVARPHNLIRQLHGTLVVTVVPVASRYLAADDEDRMRDLLVRGTRYVLAIVVPVTVVIAVLSAPILEVWLGEKFRAAAPAMAIFAGYWLLAANTGVGSSALVAAGQLRALTVYAWVGAILNVTIALVLTPRLGLEGVVISTAAQTVIQLPWFIILMVRHLPVTLAELVGRAWWPAYATGGVLAVGLLLLNAKADLESVGALAATAAAAVALAAAAYWVIWFDEGERALIKSLVNR